ncbi:MAG: UDP-glucose 4-epimerase GalE [Xanthomonadales bacterium]|nr:UDP-glucose 4-epimerase GalE [Xanthomonadales bacterium]
MPGNVMVTGGAGYVGSHACKALKGAGYQPVVVDNLSRGHRWAVKWGPLHEVDISDPVALGRIMLENDIDAVMHFAAQAYVAESVRDPRRYYHNNVVGSLALLDAMRQNGIDKIVFSSSCATYGVPRLVPIPEAHPQFPINPYGRTKLLVEQALRDYGQAYGLRSVSLRYFNAAGADPMCEIGELHDPETHLIPLALEAAAGLRENITVHGRDYDTLDGTCVRDFIHVTDLARAHVMALQVLETGSGAHTYNLGTGRGHSVQQVIDAVADVTGRDLAVIDGSPRPGDPPTLVADATRAFNRLQWTPEYTELDAIIDSAWKWLKHRIAHPQSYG